MTGPSPVIALASIDASEAVQGIPDATLEERARAAMLAVQGHWLATAEEDQFMAACEGLARNCSAEETERIIEDLRRIKRASQLIGALQAGIPVDLEAMEQQAEEEDANSSVGPLDLRAVWREVYRP